MTGKRLIVQARKDAHTIWSWQGGYVEEGEHQGRPYFQRDTADGGDKFYLLFNSNLNAWFFCERWPVGARIAYSVRSQTDAASPEAATWDPAKVQRILVKQEDAGDDDAKGLFVDPDFPHSMTSINRPGKRPIQLDCDTPQWFPGRKMRAGDWQLFDGIDPRDLLQGELGNCWLIASLAAMAAFPKEIRKIFLRDGFQERDGKYVLRLFDHHQGKMRDVTVDEYVPCRPKRWWHTEAQALFAQTNGNELWCLVIEKAMAKIFGSYGELSGGSSAAAFRALTGMKEQILWERHQSKWVKMLLDNGETARFETPATGKETKSSDELFAHLRQCAAKSYLLAASIQGAHEYERHDGLVEGHAYSVIQVQDIVLDGRTHLRLMELRNPWGKAKEWNGAWSDGHVSWSRHPEVAKQLRPEFADDGAFWMSWQDFASIYTSVFICPKAMREGDEALAHAAASLDWRQYRPSPQKPKPPSRSVKGPPVQSAKEPQPFHSAKLLQPAQSFQQLAPAPALGAEGAGAAGHPAPPVATVPPAEQHRGQAEVPPAEPHRWQVEVAAGRWQDYPTEHQELFDQALRHGAASVPFKARGQDYEMVFQGVFQRHTGDAVARWECVETVQPVQRNQKTGRERPVRSLPPTAAAVEAPAQLHQGDPVYVWSGSKSAWATDGVVAEVLDTPAVVDGASVPAGTVKVVYDHGRSFKWLTPTQLPHHLRRATDRTRETAGPPAVPTPAKFQPRPRVPELQPVHLEVDRVTPELQRVLDACPDADFVSALREKLQAGAHVSLELVKSGAGWDATAKFTTPPMERAKHPGTQSITCRWS